MKHLVTSVTNAKCILQTTKHSPIVTLKNIEVNFMLYIRKLSMTKCANSPSHQGSGNRLSSGNFFFFFFFGRN